MAIIISKNGKNAVRVDKSTFDKEDYLQKYIYENPESIPLYDIKEDIKLLILSREFPTNSGPIDALGIDKDGEIYIVETKLYKNPDKRTVIAQALDYGAALWKHSGDFAQFISTLENNVSKTFGISLVQKLQEFFELAEEDTAALLESVRKNLSEGAFRFVVLMDQLDARLKDLVVYVNQNSQFDVYAVELEYYKYEANEIIIPKIFGAEVKKDIAISPGNSLRKKWTEQMLLEDARHKFSEEEFRAFEKIYSFSKQHASEVRLGTGSYGSFNPIFEKVCDKSLYTLATDGRLSFNFHWISNKDFVHKYRDAMQNIGFTIPENYTEVRPSIQADEWVPKSGAFLSALSAILK